MDGIENLKSRLEQEKNQRDKYYCLYKLCKKWIHNKNVGVRLEDKLKKAGAFQVALYGWGELAWLLTEELKNSDIKVTYIIDINAENISSDIPVYSLKEQLPVVDLIIVTIVNQYEKIEFELKKITNNKICSLDDIVCETQWRI